MERVHLGLDSFLSYVTVVTKVPKEYHLFSMVYPFTLHSIFQLCVHPQKKGMTFQKKVSMIPSKRNLNLDGRIMQHLWLWMEKEILRYSFSFLSRDLRPRLYNTLLLETPKTLFFQKAFRISSNEWKSNRFPNFFPRDDCFHIPKVDQKAKNVFITQSFLVSFTQPRPKKKVKATASFYSFY